jgi:hypothetical protein
VKYTMEKWNLKSIFLLATHFDLVTNSTTGVQSVQVSYEEWIELKEPESERCRSLSPFSLSFSLCECVPSLWCVSVSSMFSFPVYSLYFPLVFSLSLALYVFVRVSE